MNKEELVQEVAKKAKVTQKEAAEIINAFMDTVQKTVAKGKKVTLVGFGTFEARKRAARTGRNPQTGKAISIPAKYPIVAIAFRQKNAIAEIGKYQFRFRLAIIPVFLCSGSFSLSILLTKETVQFFITVIKRIFFILIFASLSGAWIHVHLSIIFTFFHL